MSDRVGLFRKMKFISFAEKFEAFYYLLCSLLKIELIVGSLLPLTSFSEDLTDTEMPDFLFSSLIANFCTQNCL